MRTWLAALLLLPAASTMAAAMDAVSSANSPQITRQLDAAAAHAKPGPDAGETVVEESMWEAEAAPTPDQKRFSRTQSDELVSRLGFEDGKAEWARFDLKDSEGNGPAIAGTFDGGAAKMVLRWKHD